MGQLRQVFNDTEAEVLWPIVGAVEETELLAGAKTKPDKSLIYPVDSKQLPRELAAVEWPPENFPIRHTKIREGKVCNVQEFLFPTLCLLMFSVVVYMTSSGDPSAMASSCRLTGKGRRNSPALQISRISKNSVQNHKRSCLST